MHDHTRRSRHQRTRAIDRLRTLTVGTTLAGVAATAGFGGLAAITYHGFDDQAPDNGASTLDGSQDDATTPTLPPVTNNGTAGQDNGATNGAAPRIAAAPTPAPTPRKTHHAHVSSGGSGG